MRWRSWVACGLGGAVVGMALPLLTSGAQAASSMGKVVFHGTLYGNIPDVTVRGVKAGLFPWVVKGGAEIFSSGEVVVHGTGLLIPAGMSSNGGVVPKKLVGTTAGVKAVMVALSCSEFKTGQMINLGVVPLSAKGDFSLSATRKIPARCNDPIVLVGPGKSGKMIAWFATTNFLKYGLWSKTLFGWGMNGAAAMGSVSTSTSASAGYSSSKTSSKTSGKGSSGSGW